MPDDLVYYSTNTKLAFELSERYYKHIHFVWCTPFFGAAGADPTLPYTVPPSSSPKEIYQSLMKEVAAGDLHSAKIEGNRVGLRTGASVKRAADVITAAQESEINSIIDVVSIQYFRPLLYVIPCHRVAGLVELVPVGERANPLSVEYKIVALPRDCFDILSLE